MSITKLIWTRGYRPFILGGDVNAPIGCIWDVEGPFDLGKGIEAYLGIDPDGKTFAVERTTGAIIGDTIEQVRGHVEDADEGVMEEQIEQATLQLKQVVTLDADEFWKLPRRKS